MRAESRKMSAIIAIISVLFFIIVKNVSGSCIRVPNDDMIEYSCENGDPYDLYSIPERTEKIKISNMKLPHITRDTFSRFGDNLWVLTCSNCGITDIDSDAFNALTNLQQVRLDNNKLNAVKASWFEGLKYITYLDLNYNQIETIENGVFNNLPSLVDLRISGNKLQCLNVDELGQLSELQRIFLSRNAEFKCPNAITNMLEKKQVNFERDPEWNKIVEDLIKPETISSLPYDDLQTPSPSTETPTSVTPMYRERLIISRPTESSTSTTITYPTIAPHPTYSEFTELPQDWPLKPQSPSSYSTWWPKSTTTSRADDYDTPSTDSFPLYKEIYYPPQVPTFSNADPYQEVGDSSVPSFPRQSTTQLFWSENSDEVFNETEFPTIDLLAPIHSIQSTETSLYDTDLENYQITERQIQSQAYPMGNYQQVDELEPITITSTNIPTTDKPLPKCTNSSSPIILSIGVFIFTIFCSITRTF